MSDSRSIAVDAVDASIIRELARDARLSLTELGRRVSLSRPAVADRIRRLEDSGVITGYGVQLDLARLGFGLKAHVSLRPRHRSGWNPNRLRDQLLAIGNVLSCVHVTGESCYDLAIAVRDASHLEQVIERLAVLGDTKTSVILSESISSHDVDITDWILRGAGHQ
jgi:Lrp/AsnC family leucine-responsive transcriptional regulator